MKILLTIFLMILSGVSVFAQNEKKQEQEELARQYTATGELDKAVDIYQKLYTQNNKDYYDSYFNSLLKIKKYEEAENITKKMIAQNPKNYRFVIALGRVYSENNNQAKATEIYDGLINNMPADSATIVHIATDFSRANNIDYTIKAYTRGRKLLNNNQDFAWDMAYQYRYKKNKPNMIKELLTQLEVKPKYEEDVKRMISATFDSAQDYILLKADLLQKIKQHPKQTVYANLLTWQFLQQKQFAQAMDQALALDRQNKDNENNIYKLCQTLADNNAFDEAIRGYEYLIAKGKKDDLYELAKINLVNTKKSKVTSGKPTQSDLAELEKEYKDLLSEFGQTKTTANAMANLASLQSSEMNNPTGAEKTLTDLVAIHGLRSDSLAIYKLQLGDIYLINNRPWDATLIYSQVEKERPHTPEGQNAQYRNARLAFYTGDFTWAKEQLSVLKAETSELIDNDALNLSLLISDHTAFDTTGKALKMYARAELLIFKGATDQAVTTLDSIDKVYPDNDLVNDILMSKAHIFIKNKDYKAAIEPLKKIVDGSPNDLWADDAAFLLGDLYQKHLNDNNTAKSWYQKIILNYTSSLWINEARKRFQELRSNDNATS